VTETAYATFGEDQRKLTGQVLKPRKIGAKGGPLVEIDVKGGDINEGKFEKLCGWKVRIADKAVRILILGDPVKILKESFNFPSPIPSNDGWRNLFRNTVNQEGRMSSKGSYTLLDLSPDLPSCTNLVEKTDVGLPWHVHNDPKPMISGLVEKGKRRNGIGQDGIDAGLPHQCEV